VKKILYVAFILLIAAYLYLLKSSSNSDIENVKKSSIPISPIVRAFLEGIAIDKSTTIGSAVAKIAGVDGTAEWKSFRPDKYQDNSDIRCVQVVINKKSDKGNKLTAAFQFLFNRNTKYVELSYFDVNGKPKSILDASMALQYGIIDKLSENPSMTAESGDETVCVKKPQSGVINTILNIDKGYYADNTKLQSTIVAANADINGDGIVDIIYTDAGQAGSCGHSYSALLGTKDGSYKSLNRYIDCAADCITLKKTMVNGFRVVISGGDKLTYDAKDQIFVKNQLDP